MVEMHHLIFIISNLLLSYQADLLGPGVCVHTPCTPAYKPVAEHKKHLLQGLR